MIGDWRAYAVLILSLLPFINNLNISRTNHTAEIISHHKYVEKYQLLGELRDYCESARDCREFAYVCTRSLCECAEGYRADERNKTCVGGVGAKCHYDSNCIENAFCRHQLLCFCKKEYWMVSDDYWNCKAEWDSKGSRVISKLLTITLFMLGPALIF